MDSTPVPLHQSSRLLLPLDSCPDSVLRRPVARAAPRKDLAGAPEVGVAPSEASFTAMQVSVWETDPEDRCAVEVCGDRGGGAVGIVGSPV